jgi:hypothetical protein
MLGIFEKRIGKDARTAIASKIITKSILKRTTINHKSTTEDH